MSTDAQIQALLRKLEAEEQELVRQRRSIAEVAERRQADYRRVQELCGEKSERLSELRGKGRARAAREKRMEELSTGAAFIARLQQEIKALQPELEEKRADAERANERLAALEGDLKKMQVEKRKLERLLESRYQAGRVAEEAREEAVQDEMTRMQEKTRGRE